jgi:methylated-DNA-[protein]-cysteine S-methyltransferase
MTDLFLDSLDTPLGPFSLVVDEAGRLCAAGWSVAHARMEQLLAASSTRLVPATDPGGVTHALARYFAGDPGALDDLPLAATGTPFQARVWRALRTIPCGEIRSYAQIAAAIGRPRAVRAVGLANGQNPIAIVVPCHRVIGSNGSLTGYAGGLDRKRWLLAHERAHSGHENASHLAGMSAAS